MVNSLVIARRPSLPDRLGKWGRRHRSIVAMAGALLLLAAGVLGASTVIVMGERDEAELQRGQAVRRTVGHGDDGVRRQQRLRRRPAGHPGAGDEDVATCEESHRQLSTAVSHSL